MTISEHELKSQINEADDLIRLARPLQELLDGPYQVSFDGRLLNIKALVDRVNDLRIEIRHREHYPPHFHVIAQNIDASFDVESGELLSGQLDPRHLRLIKWWHDNSRNKLIEIWNRTRPTDCPVGLIKSK